MWEKDNKPGYDLNMPGTAETSILPVYERQQT